jgi:hypothetical protein
VPGMLMSDRIRIRDGSAIALTRSGASAADSANSIMKRPERAGSDCRGLMYCRGSCDRRSISASAQYQAWRQSRGLREHLSSAERGHHCRNYQDVGQAPGKKTLAQTPLRLASGEYKIRHLAGLHFLEDLNCSRRERKRCSRPPFIRVAGTVQTRSVRFISSHRQPKTSPERAAVRIANSKAAGATPGISRSCLVNSGTSSKGMAL